MNDVEIITKVEELRVSEGNEVRRRLYNCEWNVCCGSW